MLRKLASVAERARVHCALPHWICRTDGVFRPAQGLTAFVTFFLQGSAAQIVGSMLITAVFIAVLHEKKPYIRASDDTLAILLQWELFFVQFALLLYKIDLSQEPKPEAQAASDFGLVKVALIVLMPAYQCVVIVLETLFARRRLRDRKRHTRRASEIADEAEAAIQTHRGAAAAPDSHLREEGVTAAPEPLEDGVEDILL